MGAHESYMYRCLQLARLGGGNVAPNPMVGAVLVYEERILAEGYHRVYGGPHAEPDCLSRVQPEDQHLLSQSTLYVSLEPCAHFGKTPPCADLIIRSGLRRVVIGCRDPFEAVNGKGIEKLEAAGITVVTGVLEAECKTLNQSFFTFHTRKRPHIILKWAQTANGRISSQGGRPLKITHPLTDRIVHRWRSDVQSILVGRTTAVTDNPTLTTRLWPGRNPLRLLIDSRLEVGAETKLFDTGAPTLVFNQIKHTVPDNRIVPNTGIFYYQVEQRDLPQQICQALYELKVLSVLVEGGSITLQSFINTGLWDEARVLTNPHLTAEEGTPAPLLGAATLTGTQAFGTDALHYYSNPIL